MIAMPRTWRRFLHLPFGRTATTHRREPAARRTERINIEFAADDPLLEVLQNASGAVDVATLTINSPAKLALQRAGVKLVVPLISHGELIGVLNLGPRLSDQDYSSDDRKLLENLAAHAAPALRVAQLVREQAAEAETRQRIAQELEVARLIQQNFLPKQLPELPGWHVRAYYRPAREVGGDFYDFIDLSDGQIGIIVGDVTDKGVPAALVMAATRSVLRASAQRLLAPGEVLARVNDVICPETPPNMFVTCLYAVLDPHSGDLRFANAGHHTPCIRRDGSLINLRARGMPLGLMPAMSYEEQATQLQPGDDVVLYSDGLVEAHNSSRQMFGFERLRRLIAEHSGGPSLIEYLASQLDAFTGADREPEDDVTLVTLSREPGDERVLDHFVLASIAGNERAAMQRVGAVAESAGLSAALVERLKTAVAEAVMNAIEHGNAFDPDLCVGVQVVQSERELIVGVSDDGQANWSAIEEQPDLAGKLAGSQPARGWGMFLMRELVDEVRSSDMEGKHCVSLHVCLDSAVHG